MDLDSLKTATVGFCASCSMATRSSEISSRRGASTDSTLSAIVLERIFRAALSRVTGLEVFFFESALVLVEFVRFGMAPGPFPQSTPVESTSVHRVTERTNVTGQHDDWNC